MSYIASRLARRRCGMGFEYSRSGSVDDKCSQAQQGLSTKAKIFSKSRTFSKTDVVCFWLKVVQRPVQSNQCGCSNHTISAIKSQFHPLTTHMLTLSCRYHLKHDVAAVVTVLVVLHIYPPQGSVSARYVFNSRFELLFLFLIKTKLGALYTQNQDGPACPCPCP